MKDVGGAVLAGSTPPFRGRERAAVNVDVGPGDERMILHQNSWCNGRDCPVRFVPALDLGCQPAVQHIDQPCQPS